MKSMYHYKNITIIEYGQMHLNLENKQMKNLEFKVDIMLQL